MKVLIVSDTHRNHENLDIVLEKEAPIDYLIHCGDTEGYEDEIQYAAGCATSIVLGNNDFFSRLPKECEFEICGIRIMVTHGHYYYVSMGVERLLDEAMSRGVDVVMFGHTHRPYLEDFDGLTVLNPGSIAYPRQSGRQPSYAIMEIDEDGNASYEIRFLEK